MGWDQLWSFYLASSQEIQEQILKEIALADFLLHKSYRVQYEVLSHAPMPIVRSLQPILELTAQKKLGLEVAKPSKISKKTIRMLLR